MSNPLWFTYLRWLWAYASVKGTTYVEVRLTETKVCDLPPKKFEGGGNAYGIMEGEVVCCSRPFPGGSRLSLEDWYTNLLQLRVSPDSEHF